MQPDHHLLSATAARSDAAIVIVLFHPSASDLANLVRMARWGALVVAVVNEADDVGRDAALASGAQVILNTENLGLARALNQGIAAAFDGGAGYVLLLDQDSRPRADMFDRLLGVARVIEAEGRALACVAPVLRDRKATTDLAESATFATSGTLLTRVGWDRVGQMWEALFIDGIDHEWCFRARARGLETVQVGDAVLEHDMGEGGINVLGRYRPLHRSPVRHYYIVRNTLWLARKRYIPIGWRLRETIKLAYRVPAYVLVSSERAQTVRNLAAALADGIAETRRRCPA